MDPNVKRITRVGRSNWILFGGGFLGVGLLIAILLLTMRPWPIDFGEFAILAGAPLFLAAILLCVRSGVILDRQRCIITIWSGLLVPIVYGTKYSFSRPQDVTLSYDVRQGVKANYAVYPVRVEGPGSDTLTIHEPGDHDKARQLAEEIAKFLNFGIRDRSSAEVVVREAGTLDQPLRERMRRAGRSVPLPAQPPGARAILNYGGTRAPTTIEIPPTPVGECLRLFLIGMAIAGAMAITLELVLRYKANVEFGVATLCIFVPALLVLPLLLIRAAILRERLVVSTEEIFVTRRDIFGTWTTRLAGAEIEEVALIQAGYLRAYGSGRGGESRVEIRRDRGSFQVGEALSNQEVHWLRDVLIHVLTARLE